MKQTLPDQAVLDHTQNHVHVAFYTPHKVVSSAVLNGGSVRADHLVNLRVHKHQAPVEDPEKTLEKYCSDVGWNGTTVGMMTAASMDSFRLAKESVQGVEVTVLVTTGLSNPRRAGDRADYRELLTCPEETGTINIIALTSSILTDSAMVEAMMIATEAKSAALQDAGIRSPVSDKIATGTGTDSIAVVCGHGPGTIRYCGKHVLFGEILGRLVTEALSSSVAWYLEERAG